jgi:hypothetical protein
VPAAVTARTRTAAPDLYRDHLRTIPPVPDTPRPGCDHRAAPMD